MNSWRGGSQANCLSVSGECSCFEMRDSPREAHLLFVKSASKPVCQHPYHAEEWPLENPLQSIIVTRECTLCHHKKRLAKGQVYTKIKQVFINKCYIIHSVRKHSWMAKTFWAQQISKWVKSQTWGTPKGHFYEDQKIPLTPYYLFSPLAWGWCLGP